MDLSEFIKTYDLDESADRPLHLLFATSEVAPFSKTGGLADVSAALPNALSRRGHHVTVVTPLYGHLDPQALGFSQRMTPLEVPTQGAARKKVSTTVWEGRIGSVRFFFLDAPEFFDRQGLYGDAQGAFDDNAKRFAFFSRALVELAATMSVPFDAIHCNDWHTALAPLYGKYYYPKELDKTRFVLTIHNLAFQGDFPLESFGDTGLPANKFKRSGEVLSEDGSRLNFLRAGLLYSDQITTVSPTYAREIVEQESGHGLSETLKARQSHLSGILNGADYRIWQPDKDKFISVPYDIKRLNGKRQNKAELQHLFGLPVRPVLPLLGFIGRLTEQKGLDALLPALESMLANFSSEREGFQVVFLGEGESTYAATLERLQQEYPNRFAVKVGYSEELAHQIQAGSDILLVPSRFEPCGLTQIYAMRYGTLPLVHATGGLADTVKDAQADREAGTGFVFEDFSAQEIAQTIRRAIESYRHYRQWRPLMVRAMEQDFSWAESAKAYEEIYQSA